MNGRRPIPKKLRFQVLERDGFTCRYCGARPPNVVLHLDHVVAVAKGGGNTLENLVTACLPCNIGKGVMDADAPDPLRPKPVGAGSRAAPPIEFFWATDHTIDSHPIVDARCFIIPDASQDEAPWEWTEIERYGRDGTRAGRKHGYSTHGISTRGFSPYEAAMYASDILHNKWASFEAYVSFIDDLLICAEAGHLPQYAAPFVLRALHVEIVTDRCGRLTEEEQYLADRLAKQAIAVFKPFLNREHWAYGGDR